MWIMWIWPWLLCARRLMMGTRRRQINVVTVRRVGLCVDAVCWAFRQLSDGRGLMAWTLSAMHHLTFLSFCGALTPTPPQEVTCKALCQSRRHSAGQGGARPAPCSDAWRPSLACRDGQESTWLPSCCGTQRPGLACYTS